MTGREFFTTRTVAEALAGFAPSRRTAKQQATLVDALRRVPAHDIVATVSSIRQRPGAWR